MSLTSSVSFLWGCLPACLAFVICRKAFTRTYALVRGCGRRVRLFSCARRVRLAPVVL
jgi:hypothetical protein